jgi:hypothetical protein
MITSKEIIDEINYALKQFGEYTYNDKGAREVMDLEPITEELKTMSAEDVLKVLTEVETNHPNPEPFLYSIICSLDSWKDPNADVLFDSELFAKYY